MEQAQLREQEALCLHEAHASESHLTSVARHHLNPSHRCIEQVRNEEAGSCQVWPA